MPEMGIPQSAQRGKGQFGQIRMANKRFQSSLKDIGKNRQQDAGEVLNNISGKGNMSGDVKVVDSKNHNKMGKDEFLKLLAHQMQNQDPLNPLDQNKFAADLAQFSQLEQMANMNTNIKGLTGNKEAESKHMAASFLGKKVVTNGAAFKLNDLGKADVNFSLDGNAEKVLVRIYDQKNQLIRQMDFDGMPKGNNSVSWDGVSNNGLRATPGEYKIQVIATNDKFEPIKTHTKASGVVTGVHFEGGETVFTVDGSKKVFLRDVDSFSLPNQEKPKLTQMAARQLNSHSQGAQMPQMKPNMKAGLTGYNQAREQ